MPRYRFSWSNIDRVILEAVTSSLSLTGEPAASLQAKYGLRPKENFIQDAWPTLLPGWLNADSESCAALAKALRNRGLGQVNINDDYSFLQSCRNTQGLRQEALYIFLRKGEQSAVSSDKSEDNPVPSQEARVQAAVDTSTQSEFPAALDRNSLMKFAVKAAAGLYGVSEDKVYIDGDGDILVPCGSAAVFINVIENLQIKVFSIMVREPRECEDMYRLINEVNSNLKIGHVFYSSECIILEHGLFAKWTTQAELRTVIDIIGDLADFYDHKLQERFGGSLFLREKAEDEIAV